MTPTRTRSAVLTALVLAALLVTGAQVALSSPSLPPVAPEELLASVVERAADPPPMSGELTATLGLGLPVAPEGDSALADLLGESRLRVERSDDGLRAALLGERSERLVVTDGTELWTWDSRTLQATRAALPEHDERTRQRGLPEGLDPLAVTTRVLDLARRHADVAVDGTARVAGRAAYRLQLTPTDAGTTLGRVEVDVDAETRVPLRTALFARGATAASVEVAWVRIAFDPVDPATFSFSPPPGASVEERPLPRHRAGATHPDPAAPGPLALLEHLARVTGGVGPVTGEGFATVVVLPAPASGDMGALLPLDGPLLSVRVAEAGGQRVVLAGLVPLSRLDEVAASLPPAAP